MIPTEMLKKIRRIELRTSRTVNDVLAGQYHSAFKGRGMEFEEVRQYQVGDDVRTIKKDEFTKFAMDHEATAESIKTITAEVKLEME